VQVCFGFGDFIHDHNQLIFQHLTMMTLSLVAAQRSKSGSGI
jgi:hypothetical protein